MLRNVTLYINKCKSFELTGRSMLREPANYMQHTTIKR